MNERKIKKIVAGCAVAVFAGVTLVVIKNAPSQEKVPKIVDTDMLQAENGAQTTKGDRMLSDMPIKGGVDVDATEPPATRKSQSEKSMDTDKCSKYRLYDTVFFGDSRTLALADYEVVPEAEVIAARGIALSKVDESPVIEEGDKKITMIEALKKVTCKRVFMMFGLNELGWPYESTFKDAYRRLISQVKEAQPEARIYVQGIFPMTEGRTDEIYNNENIARFNGYIKAVAEEAGVTYIDVSKAVVNENGTLPIEASDDGIHLNKEYCGKWMECIVGIVKNEDGKE